MNINTQFDSLMTVSEVADFLHIHQNTVRRWSNRGILKSIPIGRRGDRRFIKEDIINLLNGLYQYNGDERKARAASR